MSEGLHLKHLVTVIKKAATVQKRVAAVRPAPARYADTGAGGSEG